MARMLFGEALSVYRLGLIVAAFGGLMFVLQTPGAAGTTDKVGVLLAFVSSVLMAVKYFVIQHLLGDTPRRLRRWWPTSMIITQNVQQSFVPSFFAAIGL